MWRWIDTDSSWIGTDWSLIGIIIDVSCPNVSTDKQSAVEAGAKVQLLAMVVDMKQH